MLLAHRGALPEPAERGRPGIALRDRRLLRRSKSALLPPRRGLRRPSLRPGRADGLLRRGHLGRLQRPLAAAAIQGVLARCRSPPDPVRAFRRPQAAATIAASATGMLAEALPPRPLRRAAGAAAPATPL